MSPSAEQPVGHARVELHDSTLLTLSEHDGNVSLELDAFVHRWDPASGSGCVQQVRIEVRGGLASALARLPCRLADGALTFDGQSLTNLLPLPFDSGKAIVLDLLTERSESIRITGIGIGIRAVGAARFVETLPDEFRRES